jgi:hypothetical protein
MPTTIPSYLYSLLASLIIGTILVSAVSVETLQIRNNAKDQQLKSIEQYVAAQALQLISQTTLENQTTTQYLNIPSAIGNERFWIHLTNNTKTTYLETGYGLNTTPTDKTLTLPTKATATGIYVSGQGHPILQCHYENQIITLTLTQEIA